MTKMVLLEHFNKWGWDHCKRVKHDLGTQFHSVAQSCPTLCDLTDCNTPGFPFYHQHLELAQTHVHVHWRCYPTISPSIVPFSSWLQTFPALGSFQMSQFFTSGGQSIGVSASASVLPMNIQDWSPLGWTHWISVKSKRLSRVFFNTTVQKHQLSFLYSPTLIPIHNYWKNHSFD